ncbi:MAG: hypothetical protein JJT90_15965, partial [Ectothiorhodospiraceae bacterium]|nr:hypothetical protein [Ectothiorhodospiraceae bacterium]
MPEPLRAALLRVLEREQPRTVTILGHWPDSAVVQGHGVGDLRTLEPEDLEELPALGRRDLALLGDVLDRLPAPQAEHLVAALRDLHARRLVVYLPPGSRWNSTRLRALGLSRLARDADSGALLFGFHIANYKPTPEWLKEALIDSPGALALQRVRGQGAARRQW